VGAVLTVAGVRHRRGGREVVRVDGLEIAAGERFGLLGPNGAGKTSLLRLLAAVDRPTDGEVRVDGVPTSTGGPRLRRRLAYTTQRPVLLSTTVARNVELPLRYRGVPRAARRAAATAALARLGVEQLGDRQARTLSGGEAQRVSLARALACEPDALLLDEPAAALDTPTRATFLADVDRALADRPITTVVVSHRAEEVLALADRIAVMVAGELRQVGAAAEVVARPADADVARLVGYENVLDVEIDESGAVLVAGRPTGIAGPRRRRAATLAVWAAGVLVAAPGAAPLPATVRRVTPGPGRRIVVLDAGVELVAHLPVDQPAPARGAAVSIGFDRALGVVLD
jgi:ABC-type Fe3+/spermidine/putrescine transport system ATPase subunit